MGFWDRFQKKSTAPVQNSAYSRLTQNQKLAALNLMLVFGGSCSGTPAELSKINHIMAKESEKMGITSAQFHASNSMFSGMKHMADSLKGADRDALAELFWAYYCIAAVGQQEEAVHVLMSIYRDYGFTENDCVGILERKSGRRIS